MRILKEKLKDELLRHSTVMFSATVLGGICNFLFQIFANHNLDRLDFALLYTLITLTLVVGVIGMTTLTMTAKQVSFYQAKNELGKIHYLYTHFLGKISLLALIGFVIYLPFTQKIAEFFNRPDARLTIIAAGLVMALSIILPLGYGTLQGLQRFKQWSKSMILFTLIRLFSGIILIYAGFQVTGAIGASIIAFAITFLIINFFIKDLILKKEKPVQVSLVNFYKTSWWILGSLLFCNIICFIDVLIVQHFLQAETSDYASASLLARTIFYLPLAIAASMFPKAASLAASGKSALSLLKRTLLYGLVLCTSAALLIFFASEFIVLILKIEYSEAVPGLLRMFVFALIPYALITILVYYNIAIHRVKVVGILLPLAILHVILLNVFNSSLEMVITTLAVSGTFIVMVLLFFNLRPLKSSKSL